MAGWIQLWRCVTRYCSLPLVAALLHINRKVFCKLMQSQMAEDGW